MKIKDILVHLDQTPACTTRVDAALNLARQHDACLRGLYVYESPRMKNTTQAVAQVREQFQKQIAGASIESGWLDVDLGVSKVSVVEMLSYQSCFTDLLVVSHPTDWRQDQTTAYTGIERLLLGAGSPVLVVPLSGSLATLGARIMIAWKAGPKASRAMHDAMPLMTLAKQVNLISVGKKDGFAQEVRRLKEYLTCHNLEATIEQIPASRLNIGDTLLNLCADDAIDMIVMGVHLTTVRGKLSLGEVGNQLLQQMTVPVLLTN
ncbi:MAG: universal stress protein [Desulfuromonadales bacterium]|nr:universal stress protein [Desulfuromonadales bacterium]